MTTIDTYGMDQAVWDILPEEAKKAVAERIQSASKAAGGSGNVKFKVTKGGNQRKNRDGSLKWLDDANTVPDETPGGAIGIYGLNATFPISLYLSQCAALLEAIPAMVAAVNLHAPNLTIKNGEDRAVMLARFNAAAAKLNVK